MGSSGLRAGRGVSMKADKVAILVSGLPGAMGKEVAAACLRRYSRHTREREHEERERIG